SPRLARPPRRIPGPRAQWTRRGRRARCRTTHATPPPTGTRAKPREGIPATARTARTPALRAIPARPRATTTDGTVREHRSRTVLHTAAEGKPPVCSGFHSQFAHFVRREQDRTSDRRDPRSPSRPDPLGRRRRPRDPLRHDGRVGRPV